MEDKNTIWTSVVIMIVGIALIVVYTTIVLPGQRTSSKRIKATRTLSGFYDIYFQILLYERDHEIWPEKIETAVETFQPEFLSDPNGNSTVHGEFDGKGGWVYEPDKKKFYVNVEGTIGEILGLRETDDLTRSKPSEWVWSKTKKDVEEEPDSEK